MHITDNPLRRPAVASRTGRTLAALAALAVVLPAAPAAAKPIPGRYIVTLQPGHDAKAVARGVDAAPRHVYSAALNGFAAALNAGQLNALERNPAVKAIEPDGEITTGTLLPGQQPGVEWPMTTQVFDFDPWGLDRIDQRTRPLSRSYSYWSTGQGVRVYVLDTGLQADHPEFGGRAANMYNATPGAATDCNGHGTHVAGTIGAKTWGVAKNVLLRGVKVLGADCSRYGDWSDFIEGVDWVKSNHIKPAVVNMSVGGEFHQAANDAVQSLAAPGLFVAVAAGNDDTDACQTSPASAGIAFATAASNYIDEKASFSNWGPCVDAYAPGASIRSTGLGGGSALKSGTSMASPHVAGTAALMCSLSPANCVSSVITDAIKQNATMNAIKGNPVGTPNRLLWKGQL